MFISILEYTSAAYLCKLSCLSRGEDLSAKPRRATKEGRWVLRAPPAYSNPCLSMRSPAPSRSASSATRPKSQNLEPKTQTLNPKIPNPKVLGFQSPRFWVLGFQHPRFWALGFGGARHRQEARLLLRRVQARAGRRCAGPGGGEPPTAFEPLNVSFGLTYSVFNASNAVFVV